MSSDGNETFGRERPVELRPKPVVVSAVESIAHSLPSLTQQPVPIVQSHLPAPGENILLLLDL